MNSRTFRVPPNTLGIFAAHSFDKQPTRKELSRYFKIIAPALADEEAQFPKTVIAPPDEDTFDLCAS